MVSGILGAILKMNSSSAGGELPIPPSPTTDIILLAGQSNMDGRNFLFELPIGFEYLNSQVTNVAIYDWKNGTNNWQVFTPGLNLQSYSGLQAFGPELSLAHNLNNPAYFLKYAYGGSVLAESGYGSKGTWNANITNSHYAQLKEYYTSAKQDLLSQGKVGINVKAFVWLQGESDAENQVFADAYETNLLALINALKTFTGDDFYTIILRIKYPEAIYRNTVRAAQDNIPNTISNTSVIDTDASELQDYVHYSEQGNIDNGEAIATIINGL